MRAVCEQVKKHALVTTFAYHDNLERTKERSENSWNVQQRLNHTAYTDNEDPKQTAHKRSLSESSISA